MAQELTSNIYTGTKVKIYLRGNSSSVRTLCNCTRIITYQGTEINLNLQSWGRSGQAQNKAAVGKLSCFHLLAVCLRPGSCASEPVFTLLEIIHAGQRPMAKVNLPSLERKVFNLGQHFLLTSSDPQSFYAQLKLSAFKTPSLWAKSSVQMENDQCQPS